MKNRTILPLATAASLLLTLILVSTAAAAQPQAVPSGSTQAV